MKTERMWTVLSTGLALLGFLLTVYLTMQSLSGDAVAGCGGDTGCAEVLTSRWAKLGPIPVALLGVLTYLAALFGLGARLGSAGHSPVGDTLLWAVAPLLLVAGLWFSAVQIVDLGVLCPLCMASHVTGFSLMGLLMFGVMRTTMVKPKPILFSAFVAGGLLIILQLVMPASESPVQRAANPFVGRDGDAVIDDARYVSVFGGKLRFVLEDEAYIGDPRAEQVVVVLFDYACPHCKEVHQLLDDAVAQDSRRFVVVLLPLTAYGGQNPYLASDNPRFEYSHEIAALSLAVAAADHEKWIEYDSWLFDQKQPVDRTAARVKAEQLVGLPALTKQLQGDNAQRITNAVARNIETLGLLPEDQRFVPVTTTPGAPNHLASKFTDIEVLYALLDAAGARRQKADQDPAAVCPTGLGR